MKYLVLIVFSFFSNALLSEQNIETIQLNHRLASEVLPEIQIFLPSDSSARAFNGFIILKADHKTIVKIKELIQTIDTPIQRVRISLLKTDKRLIEGSKYQISADVSPNSTDIEVQRWTAKNLSGNQSSYQAQGIVGTPISIKLGTEFPLEERILIFTAKGITVSNATRYINISNGFQAVARLLPNHQVTVDIHPQFAKYDYPTGRIESSEMISHLSGLEGEWLELGRIDNEKNIEKQSTTRYYNHQQTVYIKVEHLKKRQNGY